MTATQLISLLAARWHVTVASALLAAGCAFAVSTMLPPKYTANASVIVDARGLDVLGTGGVDRSASSYQSMVMTQMDVIASDRVARRVVNYLHLKDDPTFMRSWQDDTGGHGDFVSYTARSLLKRLDVKYTRDSNVINLYVNADSGALAQAIVNRFALESVATNIELMADPATQTTAWFDERNMALRARLVQAQERLDTYQREKGLVTRAEGGMDTENTKLQQLSSLLLDVQQTHSDLTNRASQAASDPMSSADILNNAGIAALRTSLATSEAALQQLESNYRDPYPALRTAREDVRSLKARLSTEIAAVVATLRTSERIAGQRVGTSREALNAQKGRVLALMSDASEGSVLRSDVESAQHALDAATARQSQTSLEAKVQQSGLSLLSLADEPVHPSSPRLKLNTILGGLFGLLLGMGTALWFEMRRPLIRKREDLFVAGLDVLAVLPHVPKRRRIARAPRLSYEPARS